MDKIILVAFSLVFSAFNLWGQEYEITGMVIDAHDHKPIANVNVSMTGETRGTITDEKGMFSMHVQRLPAQLFFSHLSYVVIPVIVEERNHTGILILLEPEVIQIDEVTVSASLIRKIRFGDTLNVIDYDFLDDNRLILVANPYKAQFDKRLYLTDAGGRQIDNIQVSQVGKQIKFPEELTPEQVYLFSAFEGSHLLLTHNEVKQVFVEGDSVRVEKFSDLPKFLSLVFVIKACLGERLFFQFSTPVQNWTYVTVPEGENPRMVKMVHDPFGMDRYVKPPGAPRYIQKHVSAPCFNLDDSVLIFDFFDNHIEFFDAEGQSLRKVPIDFHLAEKNLALLFKVKELNQKQFKQVILKDEVTNKFFALFQPLGKRLVLKEVDVQTGKVVTNIELPDFPNVTKVKVNDGKLFFLYQVKDYPGYVSLYTMGLNSDRTRR